MDSFVFPPPPPPPPKATGSAEARPQNQSGHGRGRGGPRGSYGGNRSRGPNRGRGSFRGTNYNGSTEIRHPSNTSPEESRKRKLNAFQENRKIQPANRPNIEVAPSVPSFGFSLPVQGSPVASTPAESISSEQKKKPARKTNQLGLTPQAGVRDESEEENIDEEAAFVANGVPANLRVEHKGMVYELGNSAGLKQWLEDRKRNFPTKAKLDEKNKEALKQKQEALRRRLEEDQARKKAQTEGADNKYDSAQIKTRKKIRSTKDTKEALEKHLAKAEKLRKKLKLLEDNASSLNSDAPISNRDLPEDHNIQDPNATVPQYSPDELPSKQSTAVTALPEDESHNLESSSEISSSTDSDSDSDSDSSFELSDGSDQSDNPPDQVSSKDEAARTAPPDNSTKSQMLCRAFAATGKCKWGNRCHYKHEGKGIGGAGRMADNRQTVSAPRKSLYQRFVEQEKEAEDRLALQAIKYLGQRGVFA